MNVSWLHPIFYFSALFAMSSFCHAGEFPYRQDYPEVPIVELADVRSGFEKGEIIFVDARTKMEFDTIHIRDAVHIDFSTQQFLSDLLELGRSNPSKKIIVYDNGITCLKCYIAVQDARDEEMENVYAYDGGIQAWAEAYPADTILMGEQIKDGKKEIIPYEQFLNISLDFETFKQKIADSPSAKVIDARDPIQRTKKLPGVDNVMQIPLDKLIRNVIDKGHLKNDRLFIFDQVGRQVRWLMYYLEKEGYKDYYFLKGGATAVLKEQQYR